MINNLKNKERNNNIEGYINPIYISSKNNKVWKQIKYNRIQKELNFLVKLINNHLQWNY